MPNIQINKPKPTPKGDLHAVFAVTKRGRGYRKVRLSSWGTLSEIESVYNRLEAFNPVNKVLHTASGAIRSTGHTSTAGMHDDAPLGAGGGPVLFLAIRSQADTGWNKAPRCTAVRRDGMAAKARHGVRAL